MKKIFSTNVNIYLLKMCGKFLEKVIRNKGVNEKKS